jgi:hypothetical protein
MIAIEHAHADNDSANFDSTAANEELKECLPDCYSFPCWDERDCGCGCKRYIREATVRSSFSGSDNIKSGLRSISTGECDMGKARQVRKKKKQK